MKLFHAWFSQAAALRQGSAVYRKPDGSRVNVTRVNSDSKQNVGFYRDDERYLGEVIGAEDGGCVTPNRRVRGITDPGEPRAAPKDSLE
jgi:hypothetical protein